MKKVTHSVQLGLLLVIGASVIFYQTPARRPASLGSSEVDLKSAYKRPELIPFPSSNPFTLEKYNLGKKLFFDKRLSGSNSLSCASCHNPSQSWSDGLAKAFGANHQILDRRTPTVLNVAWGWSFFWDGRAATLEEQALIPIQSKAEMDLSLPDLLKKLNGLPEYQTAFHLAFPNEGVSTENVGRAIATFERTVVSNYAPFDHWIAGDEAAISEQAKKGFMLFNGKAACVTCHNGWNFTNGSFADNGVSVNDLGRAKIDNNPALQFTFKTATLRNIASRAPYMHDGSLPNLEAVIDNYNAGGKIRRPTSIRFLKPLALSESERAELISFLETLTSQDDGLAPPDFTGGN